MAWTGEIDLGTPAPALVTDKMVTLTIDGQEARVPEGTSIMRAAALMGTSIPKLCATDNMESFGSCRLCLVEIDGRAGPAVDPSPGVTAVQPVNHNPYDRHDKDRNDWNKDWNKKDRDRGRDWDRGWNNRWDNPWRADCFWFGPWLVCSPW